MKKVLAGILILTIFVCFAGCGNDSTKENGTADIKYEQDVGGEKITTDESKKESVTDSVATNTSKCIECGRECDEGHTYCFVHECKGFNCVLPPEFGSIYCANHSCLLCTSERSSNSPYCSSHKCNNCENVVVDGSDYCVAHKCLICDNKRFGNSSYCSTHD